MAVSTKTRAKRHAHVKKGWEAGVPKVNIMNYRESMLQVLAYFAAEVEAKVKKELAIKYWKSQGKNVEPLNKVADGYFAQAGVLAYLLSNNIALEEQDEIFLQKRYAQLAAMVQQKAKRAEGEGAEGEKPKRVAEPPNPQLAIRAAADKIGAEIDAAIDAASLGDVSFDTKDYLIKSQVSAPVAKQLIEFYKPLLKEVISAGGDNDYQASEGYAYLGKRGYKKFLEFVQSVVDACNNVAIMAKTTRKPRQRKEKPAGVIASKVKYMKEYADLKIKSLHPEKVVGAFEVWVFNIKYRKLFQYVAQDGMQLTWKGTTLQNFDPEKSGAKTIRKPEVFFKGIDTMTKRPLTKAFNEIRGVLAKATGRVNEDTLIVKVF